MKHFLARKCDRTSILVGVGVRSLRGGNTFRGNVINLGAWGLALYTKRFIGVGQPVELAFQFGNGAADGEVIKIQGSVAHARIESDGNILGIAFGRTLSEMETQIIESRRGCGSRR